MVFNVGDIVMSSPEMWSKENSLKKGRVVSIDEPLITVKMLEEMPGIGAAAGYV